MARKMGDASKLMYRAHNSIQPPYIAVPATPAVLLQNLMSVSAIVGSKSSVAINKP